MQLVTLFLVLGLISCTYGRAYDFDVQCSRSGTCSNSWGLQLLRPDGTATEIALNPNITCAQGDTLNFKVGQDAVNHPFAVLTPQGTNMQTTDGGPNPLLRAGTLSVFCQNGMYMCTVHPAMAGYIIATPVQQVQQVQQVQTVAQPVIQQPVIQQPVTPVIQPVIQQPVAQPVIQQPVIQQPVAQPVIQQPVIQQPVIQQPVIQQPVVQPVVQSVVQFTQQPYTEAPYTQQPYLLQMMQPPVQVTEAPVAIVTPVVTPVVTPYVTQPQQTQQLQQVQQVQQPLQQDQQPQQPLAEKPVINVLPLGQTIPSQGQQQSTQGRYTQPVVGSASSIQSNFLISILLIVSLLY